MTRERCWSEYLAAMRAHLAQHERLVDRLRYYVSDPPTFPLVLRRSDFAAWGALIEETAALAEQHHAALRALLSKLPERLPDPRDIPAPPDTG